MGVSEFLRKLSCPRAAVGLPETQGGNRCHTAVTTETMGSARAFRRAVDSQPQKCGTMDEHRVKEAKAGTAC
jgi:hypothetical protein